MTKPIIDEQHEGIELLDDCLFESPVAFSQFIERKSVYEGMLCKDLILDMCEKRGVDIEDISKLFTTPLKKKMKQEMIEAGLFKQDLANLDNL